MIARLSEGAISNIFNEAKELGVDTGLDAKGFVEMQRNRAKQLKDFPTGI